MALLNYTTTIDAAKTVGEIQAILAKAGAESVMVKYRPDRSPKSITFSINTQFGERWFELPAAVDKVHAVLLRQKVKPGYSTVTQAEKVAWRILKDWMEAQLAIIQTEMVTLDLVMLPYMKNSANGEMTVYELYQANQLQITGGVNFHGQ